MATKSKATKDKDLLQVLERLNKADRDDVLMFGKMIHFCRLSNIDNLSAEEWDALSYKVKSFIVDVLERNEMAAYRNLLVS